MLKLRVNFIQKTENSDATASFVVAKLCLYWGILPQRGLVAALHFGYLRLVTERIFFNDFLSFFFHKKPLVIVSIKK